MLGILSAVQSLTRTVSGSTLTYSWTPPFTLNVNDLDPDIDYCVEVFNLITLELLHSECGITITNYSYPIPPVGWCCGLIFTVTPISVAGRGAQSSVKFLGDERSKFYKN